MSPFTGGALKHGDRAACTRSPSRPELRPPFSGGQDPSPPKAWPWTPYDQPPGPGPSSLEGWGGQNFRDPEGCWAACSLVREASDRDVTPRVPIATPVASFFPLCSC